MLSSLSRLSHERGSAWGRLQAPSQSVRWGASVMPSTMIDSAVFRDLFSTAAMRRVFSDETRIQGYLDIETGWRASKPSRPSHPAAAPVRRCRKSATPAPAITSSPAHRSSASRSPHCSKQWSRITNAQPVRGKSNGSPSRRFSCSPPAPWHMPARWSADCPSMPLECATLARLLNPSNYLGLAATMVDRVLANIARR